MAVYLDMDPGHDDALALLAAMPALNVRGVSTVAGNQTVDKTYLNARRVLHLSGHLGITVARGSAGPLFRPLFVADYVHGESGLDGYDFPALPEETMPIDAQSWLGRAFFEETEPIQWIATGPLTNVARFLMGHPALWSKIEAITIMGGALEGGNVTPYAEFNIYVDPDAAAYVFASGIPLRMVGLDVTHRALLDWASVSRFRALGTPVGEMLSGLFSFFGRHEPNASEQGMPVHDVLAVAAVAAPELFVWEDVRIEVERCDETRRGQTKRAASGTPIQAAVDIDTRAFFDWLWRQLEVYRAP